MDRSETSAAAAATTLPVRALLTSLIDYAGLFPPASLPLDQAVLKYAEHRQGEHAWALGRFVVPLRQLRLMPQDVPVSVLTDDPATMPETGAVEIKAASAPDIENIARFVNGQNVFVEISDASLLDAIAANGLYAKIRTGGVTAAAFPAPEQLARFMFACVQRRIPFKATAGLHHPIRCVRPLTYEANAPRGVMHGFVNVFLAAALAAGTNSPESETIAEMVRLLLDDDPHSFVPDSDAISWRGKKITTEQVKSARRYALSFGSCSFEEPMADLRELQWL